MNSNDARVVWTMQWIETRMDSNDTRAVWTMQWTKAGMNNNDTWACEQCNQQKREWTLMTLDLYE